ncbi:MAG TPA: hypothetical protein DDW76_20445, partial [Cyanobacteria bacterium UBA11369]|nr:hypothetical protein [Cyanobacteria bacterium UBA11369]
MQEQQVENRDTLVKGATRLWQKSFGRGSRIPNLEINLLRDRQFQQQETTDRQNGWQTNQVIFVTTETAKIIPKTD